MVIDLVLAPSCGQWPRPDYHLFDLVEAPAEANDDGCDDATLLAACTHCGLNHHLLFCEWHSHEIVNQEWLSWVRIRTPSIGHSSSRVERLSSAVIDVLKMGHLKRPQSARHFAIYVRGQAEVFNLEQMVSSFYGNNEVPIDKRTPMVVQIRWLWNIGLHYILWGQRLRGQAEVLNDLRSASNGVGTKRRVYANDMLSMWTP